MSAAKFLFVVTALFCVTCAQANGPLRSVVVFGNEKTETKTILDLINVAPETFVNNRLVEEVDDRLVHSGLFKNVKVLKTDNTDGTSDLRITVVEKQLWFVFPVFQAWSGRYSGGAAFGESNLFFANTSTMFLVQGGNRLGRVFTAIDAKNLFDTNFAMRAWMLGRSDDVPLYDGDTKIDQVNQKDAVLALTPGYQWTNDIRTAVTFTYRYVDQDPSTVTGLPAAEGNDISIIFEFVHDSLRRREAFLKGNRLRASYEFADTRFGTDFKYHIERVEWTGAIPAFRFFNYVVDLDGAIGDTLPFHREFTLGGSSLRGYADRQLRGDTRLSAKQDLLFRIFKHSKFSVFGDIFYDMGLLYLDSETIGLSHFRNGTGAGLRVSLSDILAPVFGVDVAYGIEDKKLRTYLALGLVEF